MWQNYLKTIPAIGWLVSSALMFGIGEYFSKKWGDNQSILLTVGVVFSYAVGTLLWLPALLHKNELARMGTLWYLLTTPTTILIGVCLFNEQLTRQQWVGIGFAAVALYLLK